MSPDRSTTAVPVDPVDLFVAWFEEVVAAGVTDPHAMTLSTVDGDGYPDARVLILKKLTADGRWCFAGGERSAKGRQLAAHPVAALSFWWPALVRAVRIRGEVAPADPVESAADFGDRSLQARAVAVAGRTSTPLLGLDIQRTAVSRTTAALRRGEQIDSDWTLWALQPRRVEFWQGVPDRQHVRVHDLRADHHWTHHLLWS